MSKNYKILGVDPGTNIMGYSILQVDNKDLKLITMGVVNLKSYPDHQTKLKEIYLQLQEIIETYLPAEMAIEAPFYGKNIQSMLKLGRAQGVCMAAAITMGLEIIEYSPKKIKQSITGNGNASKEQVSAMLTTLMSVNLKNEMLDATDALAAAVCHFHQRKKLGSGKNNSDWDNFIKNNPQRVSGK